MACKNGNFPCSKCPLLSPYNKPFNAKCENFGIFSCTFTSAEEKFFNYISQIWMMVVMPMAIISCLVYHFTTPESIFHVQVFMLATRACKISAKILSLLTQYTVYNLHGTLNETTQWTRKPIQMEWNQPRVEILCIRICVELFSWF